MAGFFLITIVKLIVKISLYTVSESFWSSSHPEIISLYNLVFILWFFAYIFILFLQKWDLIIHPVLLYH